MKIIEKIEQLKCNSNIFSAYDYQGLTAQEIFCTIFTKLNECVSQSNDMYELAKWLVDEGLSTEVIEQLQTWLNDGTLENVINVGLFNSLNEKITNIENEKININMFNGSFIEKMKQALGKANEGQEIFIPSGSYDVDDVLLIDKNVNINGNNCTLNVTKPNIHEIIKYENVNNVEVKNINFDCKLLGRNCITFNNSYNINVNSCSFKGYSKEFGYYKTDSAITINDCENITIDGNVFTEFGYQYDTTTADLNRCISVQGVSINANVINNTFDKVNQAIVTTCEKIFINNNMFLNVRDNAIYSFGKDVVISSNLFDTKHDEGIVFEGGDYQIINNIFKNIPNKSIAFCGDIYKVDISHNNFLSTTDGATFIATRSNTFKILNINISHNKLESTVNTSPNFFVWIPNATTFNFNENYIKVPCIAYQKIINIGGNVSYGTFNNNTIINSNINVDNAIALQYDGSNVSYFEVNSNKLEKCRLPYFNSLTYKNQRIQVNVGPYLHSPTQNTTVYGGGIPTSGVWRRGDFIQNMDISDSKIFGWSCISEGSPGTWVELKFS